MPPVFQEASRFGSNLPLAGMWKCPPSPDMASHVVDDRRDVVPLILRGQFLDLVKGKNWLIGGPLSLLRLRNGRDEVGATAGLDDRLRWLAIGIEFPMPNRTGVRGVQDRVLEEGI